MPDIAWRHDPVVVLLALALLDNVFDDARVDAQSIYSRSEQALPRGRDVTLPMKEEVGDVSVFRKIECTQGVWSRGNAAMGYDEALRGFKKACFLAGFLGERSRTLRRSLHPLRSFFR